MPAAGYPKIAADWFFELAPVRPMVEHWQQLQQDTLTRLGLTGGKIDLITISKQKRLLPQNDLVLVVVHASSGIAAIAAVIAVFLRAVMLNRAPWRRAAATTSRG